LARLEDNADIDLLFTDVVLPHGMSGPDIAREAKRQRPDIKIVFTSGYPDKEIGDLAWEGERPRIVSKPYTKAKLAEALLEHLS
jgi:CheY-like chemotaxis protein